MAMVFAVLLMMFLLVHGITQEKVDEHNAKYERGEVSWRMEMPKGQKYRGYSKSMQFEYNMKAEADPGTVAKNLVPIDVADDYSITIETPEGGMKKVYLNSPVDELPKAVDWRESGYITPVKNQAACGNCWVFGSIEALEFYAGYNSKRTFTLSTQQITECSSNEFQCGGTGGCGGGIAEVAYDYVIDHSHGVTSSTWMPYVSGTNITCVKEDPSQYKFTCHEAETGYVSYGGQLIESPRMYVNLTGYTVLPTNQYEVMMNAIAKIGPVVINIYADEFASYAGGVYDGCSAHYGTNTTDVDHVVTIEGYGIDPEHGEYWLMRNSWGAYWGEAGYMRIKRTSDDGNLCDLDKTPGDGYTCALPTPSPAQRVCGPCGMLSRATIPLGAYYMNAKGPSRYTDPALTKECPQSCTPEPVPPEPVPPEPVPHNTSSNSTSSGNDSACDNDKDVYFVPMVVLAALLLVALGVNIYQGMMLQSANARKTNNSNTSNAPTSNPIVARANTTSKSRSLDDPIPPGGEL